MKRILPFFIFVIIVFLFSTSMASDLVQARVRIIEASNDGSGVDTALREIHRELGSLFSFTSYRLLKDVNLNLRGSRPMDVFVHPGRSVEITLVGEYKSLVELRIRVKREGTPILSTNVRLSPGRTVLIGGPRHGEGTIIFAVSARF